MSEDLEPDRFGENFSNTRENDTKSGCESFEMLDLLASPKTIFKIITAIVIILANTVLVSVILRSNKFRGQRFHKFIVSLAFADLLIGVTIPFMTLTAKEHTWHLGPSLCQVSRITRVLKDFDMLKVLTISLARCSQVCRKLAWPSPRTTS